MKIIPDTFEVFEMKRHKKMKEDNPLYIVLGKKAKV